MRKIGSYLMILGVIAIAMRFANYVPRILTWIYNWGENTAWGIKIGIVVVGAILYFAGGKKSNTSTEA